MTKGMTNAAILGCFALGTMMVVAIAEVKDGKGNCSGCPSKAKTAAFMGDGDGCGGKKAADTAGGCSKSATKVNLAGDEGATKAGCSAPCDKAMSELPQLTYRVGELDTPCMKTADQTSREKNQPVKFVVNGESFDDCGPAAVKLASLLESRIPTMGEIVVVNESAPSASGCPHSGKTVAQGEPKTAYKVAGVSFASMKEAEAAQVNVRAALANFTTAGNTHGATAGCAHAAEMTNKATCGGAKTASDTAAGEPAGCCMKKAAVATASDTKETKGCCSSMKAAAQVAVAAKLGVCCDLNTISEGGCCPEVQKLVSVRSKIRTLVEAAMSAAPKTEQTASL